MVVAAGVAGYLLASVAGTRRALGYWALTPQLLMLTGVNYDVLPVLITVAAVAASRSGRQTSALMLLVMGGLMKLFPFASAPVQLLRGERRVLMSIAALAVIVAVSMPMLLAPRGTELLLFYPTGLEANVDSVWGILRSALLSAGLPADPVVTAITLGGLALTYLLLLRRAARAQDPAIGYAIAIVVFLLWSRRYSPQYALWLLPFFALVPLPLRLFALLSVADVVIFFTIYPLTIRSGPADPPAVGIAFLAGAVALRHVGLIGLLRALLARAAAPRRPATP